MPNENVENLSPFFVREPGTAAKPLLVSVPHCGVEFPEDLKAQFLPEVLHHPEDTDWFVDRLYGFAPAMGITLVHARFSRYVIDLNRDPENRSLYRTRRETALVPKKTFAGGSLYRGEPPEQAEIERRKERFYWPYYQEIQKRLDLLKREHGQVIFFDAHSIRHQVLSIQPEPFADLILGSRDGTSADVRLIQAGIEVLSHSPFSHKHNEPFKGGQLTRYFGKPSEGVHALQLEMVQNLYMEEETTRFDGSKAQTVQNMLSRLFENLLSELGRIS